MANFPHKEEVLALQESGFNHPRYSPTMGKMTYLKSHKHKGFFAYRVRDLIQTYRKVGKEMGVELVDVQKVGGKSRTTIEIPLNMTEAHVIQVVYEPPGYWKWQTRGKAPCGVLFVKAWHRDVNYPTPSPINDDPPPPVDETLIDEQGVKSREELDPAARNALKDFLDAYKNGEDPKELEKKRNDALVAGGIKSK